MWALVEHQIACNGSFIYPRFYVLHDASRIFACVFTYYTTPRGFLHALRALFSYLVEPSISLMLRKNPKHCVLQFGSRRHLVYMGRVHPRV